MIHISTQASPKAPYPLDLMNNVENDTKASGEIPVFLACPYVDPMHSPKIGYSLCSQ